MIKNKSNFYLSLILLIHILVYFFKIDKDVFALQEYICRPQPTHTEQPFLKNVSYFSRTISDFSTISKAFFKEHKRTEHISIWDAIFLSYNSRVCNLLRLQESFVIPIHRIVSILQKQNIYHKSSEDALLHPFFA